MKSRELFKTYEEINKQFSLFSEIPFENLIKNKRAEGVKFLEFSDIARTIPAMTLPTFSGNKEGEIKVAHNKDFKSILEVKEDWVKFYYEIVEDWCLNIHPHTLENSKPVFIRCSGLNLLIEGECMFVRPYLGLLMLEKIKILLANGFHVGIKFVI
jgi:hypothetical protein